MSDPLSEVIVIDVKMKFWSMVVFMVKWAFASIPAILILMIFWAIATGVLRAMVWRPHGF